METAWVKHETTLDLFSVSFLYSKHCIISLYGQVSSDIEYDYRQNQVLKSKTFLCFVTIDI